MNKIAEWFRNLEAEFIILFVSFVILFILLLVVINAIRKIKKTITFDGFKLTEDLILVDELYSTRIRITNISFTTGVVKEIGFMEKKVKFPVTTDPLTIEERDHYSVDLELTKLREMMTSSKKIKMSVYIIDGLNFTKKRKLKLSNKKINEIIKQENNELRLSEKQVRFENGNYNLMERFKLILDLIFSPIVKLFEFIKKKVNAGLHKRQLKRQVILAQNKFDQSVISDTTDEFDNTKTVEETKDSDENLNDIDNEMVDQIVLIDEESEN